MNMNPGCQQIGSLAVSQADTWRKTLEIQEKSARDLMAFLITEAERARSLTTPLALMQFNMEFCQGLFDLINTQAKHYVALATDASQSVAYPSPKKYGF